MSATNIRVLKNRHQGETIAVVASSASMDYFGPGFFNGQIVVAINEMWELVPATYVCGHHHEQLQAAIDAGQRVVTSERDWGGPGWGTPAKMTGEYFTYRTADNSRTGTPRIDGNALREDTIDGLVVSPCTTAEGLQLAAHLGARRIECYGMEGAALDGRWCCRGYNQGHSTNPQHLRLTQHIIAQTVAALRLRGVHVCGMSPFVGFDQEGHRYTPPPVLEGAAVIRALNRVNYEPDQVPV